jgi:hypothetical protein
MRGVCGVVVGVGGWGGGGGGGGRMGKKVGGDVGLSRIESSAGSRGP